MKSDYLHNTSRVHLAEVIRKGKHLVYRMQKTGINQSQNDGRKEKLQVEPIPFPDIDIQI